MLWAIFVFRLTWALLLTLVACVIGPLLLIHNLSNALHGQGGTTVGQGQTRRGFTVAWTWAANAWAAAAAAAERARGIVSAAPVSTKPSGGGL